MSDSITEGRPLGGPGAITVPAAESGPSRTPFGIPALLVLLLLSLLVNVPLLRLNVWLLGKENVLRFWSLSSILSQAVALGAALYWRPKILSLS